ncbi:MAG: ABC transporter ATP-binding protein [Dehalococcoidales bacterium]|nr:ABC transporter ATP-binding protein [Dehalococcoidales bacterium]
MLKLNAVKAVYSGVVLGISEVSLQVEDSSIVVLLGSNGAGKSTTLKSISGILKTEDGKVEKGTITLDGKHIEGLDPERIARMGVCHLSQGNPVFPQLTTEENLIMGAYLRRDRSTIKTDLNQVYDYFPQLEARKSQKSGYLSGGEQQMVAIGRAFIARPRLMLLDEPSLGLAPKLISEIYNILKTINQELKTAMLIAEQNAVNALSIASYGYVLQNGQVGYEGSTDELQNYRVRNIYLGLNEEGTFTSLHRSPGNRENKE